MKIVDFWLLVFFAVYDFNNSLCNTASIIFLASIYKIMLLQKLFLYKMKTCQVSSKAEGYFDGKVRFCDKILELIQLVCKDCLF